MQEAVHHAFNLGVSVSPFVSLLHDNVEAITKEIFADDDLHIGIIGSMLPTT